MVKSSSMVEEDVDGEMEVVGEGWNDESEVRKVDGRRVGRRVGREENVLWVFVRWLVDRT
jgi:hypothetical protein